MLGIVGRNSRVIPNPLVMLDELRCDTIRQVRWYIIKYSGPQLPGPDSDLEIRHRQPVGSKVLGSVSFEPLLQSGEIEWDRTFGQRLASRFLLLLRQEKGRHDLAEDVLHRLHGLIAQCSLPGVGRIEIDQLAYIAIDCIRLRDDLAIHFEHRQTAKWRVQLAPLPVGESYAIVFERYPAD